jgi:secondary thiamine-phosphate synthase enzyme
MLGELSVHNLALIEDVRMAACDQQQARQRAGEYDARRGPRRDNPPGGGRDASSGEEDVVAGAAMTQFDVKTTARNQFVEITGQVRDAIAASGVKSGLCVVYCPHTTAAVTVNENADPDVVHDMLLYLNKAVPQHQGGFRHAEGNSDSHIKASLVGPSVTLLLDGGDVVLGRWQGVYFCEFDGPRMRTVMVQVLG